MTNEEKEDPRSAATLKVIIAVVYRYFSTEFLESLVSSDTLNTVSHVMEHVDNQYQVESDPFEPRRNTDLDNDGSLQRSVGVSGLAVE